MIALLQRVTQASVEVEGDSIAEIETGLLVFLGVEKTDSENLIQRLVDKTLNYRIFEDKDGRMNEGLLLSGGALLVVPQFTLAAETAKGLRPGFSSAAEPEIAKCYFDQFVTLAKAQCQTKVAIGQFGADMKVKLINDGPCTFLLQV